MEYKCPRCGSTLHVSDVAIWDWQTAPLLCDVCLQGYTLGELRGDSLKGYDVKNRTFRVQVRIAAEREYAEARLRGHGISDEVRALLSPRQLELHRKRNEK